jgi:hypothetical protein
MQVTEEIAIAWAHGCCSKPTITLSIPGCWLKSHDTTLEKVGLIVCYHDENNRKRERDIVLEECVNNDHLCACESRPCPSASTTPDAVVIVMT